MKKFFILLLSIFLIGGVYFSSTTPRALPEYCAFCDEAVVQKQKFYESEYVFGMCTHRPIFPGHCLVIPKRHVERFEELSDEEIAEIGSTLKKVDAAVRSSFQTSAYLLLQKNGVEVGQSVPHVHFHYVPRLAGDASSLTFLARMYLSTIKQPISPEEMQETTHKIRIALEDSTL